MILAPLLLLVTAVVSPANKDDAAAQLAVVARSQTRWFYSDLLVLIAVVLLIPAILGLMHLLRGRGAAFGHVGGALALLGVAAVATQSGFGFIEWQMVKGAADRTQMAALLSRTEDSSVAVPIVLASGLLSLGFIVLAAGVARAGTGPRWAAALLAAAAVAVDVGYTITSGPLVIVAGALTLVAFVALARPVLVEGLGGRSRAAAGAS